MEQNILDHFEAFNGIPATSAECPEIEPGVAGTYLCDLTAGDVTFNEELILTPTLKPDGTEGLQLNYTSIGIHVTSAIETEIVELIQRETGFQVEATCNRPPIWRSTVGEKVPCTVRVLQTGEQIAASATILNDRGGVSTRVGSDS